MGNLFIDAMITVHEAALPALPLLVLSHIAVGHWHKVIRRDDQLESMTGKLPIQAIHRY